MSFENPPQNCRYSHRSKAVDYVQYNSTEGEIKDIPFRLTYIMAVAPYNFWNQNVVNILFLVVKSLEVISGFISKLMKKNSRLRHY